MFDLTSGGKGIIISGDVDGATVDAIIWLVDDSLGDAAGTFSYDDVTELASIVNFDLNTLVSGNFAFAQLTLSKFLLNPAIAGFFFT